MAKTYRRNNMSEDEEDTLLEKIKNDRERRKQRKKGRIVFIENDDDGYRYISNKHIRERQTNGS